jgi:hypothetical protein
VVQVELDPRRETADADRTNNHFPQQIRDERFAVEKPERERNPMQRARDEERRQRCERLATALAPEFLAAWRATNPASRPTPLAIAGELTASVRGKGLLDVPAGSVIRFEFADTMPIGDAAPAGVRFATVILDSETPRERGVVRPDPVRFIIHFDGSVKPDFGR